MATSEPKTHGVDDNDHDHDHDHDHEEPSDGEEDDELDEEFLPGKPVPLKRQIEMDKDDESLMRWKEKLLGDLRWKEKLQGTDPVVEFLTFRILVHGRPDIILPIPKRGEAGLSDGSVHFVLKEKSRYRLQFEFTVKNEILLGLQYSNTVWRMGKEVDSARVMMGAYGPQDESYTFVTDEEITPHGMFVRGHYTAKTVFSDDDGHKHLELTYSFEIKKDW